MDGIRPTGAVKVGILKLKFWGFGLQGTTSAGATVPAAMTAAAAVVAGSAAATEYRDDDDDAK